MQVLIAPDNKLRSATKEVKVITPALKKTIEEMVKLTKTFVDPEGVGLASTQVGLNGKYFVAKQDDDSFKAYFNPKILNYSKKSKKMFEGCLSIPNYWGEITRPIGVTVSYMDINAKPKLETMPAAETNSSPCLKLVKFKGLTGTGLAHPKSLAPVSNETSGNRIVPIRSICGMGLRVKRPAFSAV